MHFPLYQPLMQNSYSFSVRKLPGLGVEDSRATLSCGHFEAFLRRFTGHEPDASDAKCILKKVSSSCSRRCQCTLLTRLCQISLTAVSVLFFKWFPRVTQLAVEGLTVRLGWNKRAKGFEKLPKTVCGRRGTLVWEYCAICFELSGITFSRSAPLN